MNYLAHAFLSFHNADILTGNIMGDFVKGKKALHTYPNDIQKGLILHRKIDEFTDKHPVNARCKNMFRNDYGLFAGIFTDIIYDHFLANDPQYFSSEKKLFQFSQNSYKLIEANATIFPQKFGQLFEYMRKENWFYSYRTLKGIEKAFQALRYRSSYLQETQKAYHIFISNYYDLNQRYYELIEDIVTYAKNELNQLNK